MSPRGPRNTGSTSRMKLPPTVRHPRPEPVASVTAPSVPDEPAGTALEETGSPGGDPLNGVVRALDRYILEGRPRDAILQFICDGLGAAMGYLSVSIALAHQEGRTAFGGGAGYALGAKEGYSVLSDGSFSGEGPNATAMRTGRTQSMVLAETSFEWSAGAVAAGLAQLVAIPLATPDAKLGVLCVGVGENAILDRKTPFR